MTVKLLTERHMEFLSLKRGCIGSSESTLIKMPHCWKSHVTAHLVLFTKILSVIETVRFSDFADISISSLPFPRCPVNCLVCVYLKKKKQLLVSLNIFLFGKLLTCVQTRAYILIYYRVYKLGFRKKS